MPPVVAAGSLRARQQPILRADGGLRLRPFAAADAPGVLAAFSDEAIVRWHQRRFTTLGQAEQWINSWGAAWEAETDARWAVADASTDQLLGQVGLPELSLRFGVAEISYWVLPAARGRGIAGSAVAALEDWAFGTLGLHRLTVMHSVLNRASCQVAAKAGYAVEGTLRSALRHADGWHDMHVHGRTATDVAVRP